MVTAEAAKAFSTELKIIIQNDENIKDLISSEIVTGLYWKRTFTGMKKSLDKDLKLPRIEYLFINALKGLNKLQLPVY